MYKTRIYSAGKLLKSKAYVLVTEKEAIVEMDFDSFDGLMAIHAMKSIIRQLEDIVAKWQKKQEKAHGRN
jgi:hypothetical protein